MVITVGDKRKKSSWSELEPGLLLGGVHDHVSFIFPGIRGHG